VVSGDRLEAKGVGRQESYTVNIVKKSDNTGIGETTLPESITVIDGTLMAEEGTEHIELHSVDGKLLKKAKGNRLTVADTAKGVYIVVTKGEKGNYAQKIQLP
jgi:hypothetical protein